MKFYRKKTSLGILLTVCLTLVATNLCAEDQVCLDDAIKKISTYKFGDSRKNLTIIENAVRDSYNSIADRKKLNNHFTALLKSDSTFECRQFVCRQLSIIGTEKEVPVLADMLTDGKLNNIARFALERIPGEKANQALLNALTKTSSQARVGIINSLGMRGNAASVAAIQKYINDADINVAQSCSSALGKIGGTQAIKIIKNALKKTSAKKRPDLAEAYLSCAGKLLAEGKVKNAKTIYKKMYASNNPPAIRCAALVGMINSSDKNAGKIIIKALKEDQPKIQTIAIGMVRDIPGSKNTAIIAKQLPKYSPSLQARLLQALADRGDRKALPAARKAAKSNDETVKIAAYKALGALGNASVVDLLIKNSTGQSKISQVARDNIDRLRGKNVNKKLLELTGDSDPQIRKEAVRSLGKRHAVEINRDMRKVVLRDTNGKVRMEAIKSLRLIAQEEDIPKLIHILIKIKDQKERKEMEKTLLSVARQFNALEKTSDSAQGIYPAATKPQAQASLIYILGKCTQNKALPVIRKATAHSNAEIKDAAARALFAWPHGEALEDLRAIAKKSPKENYRILALRGYLRLISAKKDLSATESLKLYLEAAGLAGKDEDKKMALAGMNKIKQLEKADKKILQKALAIVIPELDNKAIQNEAVSVAIKAATPISSLCADKIKSAMEKILDMEIAKNDNIRFRALENLKKALEASSVKVVTLTGNDFSGWQTKTGDWKIYGDASKNPKNEKLLAGKKGSGVVINGATGRTSHLFSKAEFGDVRAHIEFMVPKGSNSGVYFQGRYEIQVLDSWGVKKLKHSDCGGIYQRAGKKGGFEGRPPRVNASRQPGQWQSFDVIFRAPRFDANGKKTADAEFVKVIHNGIVIHENQKLSGPTRASAFKDEMPVGPMMFQGDHGPVAYRNVWIAPMK